MEMENLQEMLKLHGQEHLLQFWSELNEEERNNLLRDIKEYVCPSLFFFYL